MASTCIAVLRIKSSARWHQHTLRRRHTTLEAACALCGPQVVMHPHVTYTARHTYALCRRLSTYCRPRVHSRTSSARVGSDLPNTLRCASFTSGRNHHRSCRCCIAAASCAHAQLQSARRDRTASNRAVVQSCAECTDAIVSSDQGRTLSEQIGRGHKSGRASNELELCLLCAHGTDEKLAAVGGLEAKRAY